MHIARAKASFLGGGLGSEVWGLGSRAGVGVCSDGVLRGVRWGVGVIWGVGGRKTYLKTKDEPPLVRVSR